MSTTVVVGTAAEGTSVVEPRRRPGVVVPPSDPNALRRLDEPAGVLSELRAIVATEPAAARSLAPRLLSDYAIDVWADQLEVLGVPGAVVTSAFATFRREIWLWLEGDRRWDQLSGHLSARVLRRASL
jgi:hypothetical protein